MNKVVVSSVTVSNQFTFHHYFVGIYCVLDPNTQIDALVRILIRHNINS